MTDDLPSIADLKHFMWRKGDLQWKLWPQQKPIYHGIRQLDTAAELIVVLCARQHGKSHLGVLMAIEDCLLHPRKCILIMGPTFKQAREIVTPRLRDISLDAPPGLIKPSKSEGKWYIGESELVIGGFDMNSSSQRGKTVQNIYIEEIVDTHPDDYIESMRSDLGPALTHSDRGRMIFLTTLPKIPDHPFITETVPRSQLSQTYFSYTIDDNKQLSKEQYEACVERCGGRDTIDFRREYLNEVIRDPTLMVVPSFAAVRHVRDFVLPTYPKWSISIDWGGVKDKTACLLICHDYLSDRELVWDEKVFEANTATSFIVDALKDWERSFPIEGRFADVPGQLLIDLAVSHNLAFTMPQKQDWRSSVNSMNVRFALDKCWVHPRCAFTSQSLQSGTLNKTRTDFERTSTLGHCDALAALMYGLRCVDKSSPIPGMQPKAETVTFEGDVTGPKHWVPGGKRFGNFR